MLRETLTRMARMAGGKAAIADTSSSPTPASANIIEDRGST
jgi:hypothetical protein